MRKIEEIYKETISTVLIEGVYTKDFWTNVGVTGMPFKPNIVCNIQDGLF